MKRITIKLPEELHRRLSAEARETGRSIAAIVCERLQESMRPAVASVYDRAADLAGALTGITRGPSV